ncbi:hypothetical protein ANFP_17550 [Acidithiobacillus ferrooxidans]|nr:hypothetical protein ANFP_17550 [Acidithiobacillus ferrooxidans]
MVVKGARSGEVFQKDADAVGAVCGDWIKAHENECRQGQHGPRPRQNIDKSGTYTGKEQTRKDPPYCAE